MYNVNHQTAAAAPGSDARAGFPADVAVIVVPGLFLDGSVKLGPGTVLNASTWLDVDPGRWDRGLMARPGGALSLVRGAGIEVGRGFPGRSARAAARGLRRVGRDLFFLQGRARMII